MLFLTEKRIHLGINEHADETTRHGVLWIKADSPEDPRTALRVPIIIDRPNLVKNGLNYATWRRVKRQIEKMGINATHIELQGPSHHYCYLVDSYKELYATRGHGRPIYTEGYA